MVVVTADVARDYLDMRAEQARLAVLNKNIVVAQSGQELAQTLFDRGLTRRIGRRAGQTAVGDIPGPGGAARSANRREP